MSDPYPLTFVPIVKPKVWGGRRLERLGKKLPPAELIGESWELVDLAQTSVTGGGGGEERSVIANGPLSGKTIRDAMRAWGQSLTGTARRTSEGGFPLLLKYLDAREHLSVQVHPSPAYASAHPDAHLKTECWFVIAAEPGSVIFKGIKPGVDRDTLRKHIEAGTVPEALEAVPAVVGEMHNLPSGTCHALGAGVLVAEIQTPSDTTFRMYDWMAEYGRPLRPMHIDQAMECVSFDPVEPATRLEDGQNAATLVETEYYTVRAHRVGEAPLPETSGCVVLMGVKNTAELRSTDGSFEPCAIPTGSTALVPAACVKSARIASDAEAVVLSGTVG